VTGVHGPGGGEDAPLSPSIPRRRSRVAPCLLAAVLLAAAASASFAQKMPTVPPRQGRGVGNLAYDFTLKDLDGRAHSLKNLRGKNVVHVVFWATWCVPCIHEIPELRAMHDRFGGRGLRILGVALNQSQTREVLRLFTRDLKINYPVLFDEDGAMAGRYRVYAIPQNILIGKDGIIRYAGTSLPPDYERLVESLLEEGGGARASGR
jgi:peroxiredoxin